MDSERRGPAVSASAAALASSFDSKLSITRHLTQALSQSEFMSQAATTRPRLHDEPSDKAAKQLLTDSAATSRALAPQSSTVLEPQELYSPSFGSLSESLSEYLNQAEISRVREAYKFSDEAHLGQFRASGEPYISHPLAVAEICSGWHLDAQALCAALLHDVMEDQGITKQQLVEHFGTTIADLVDGLSKLDKIESQTREDAEAENFRKIVLAMSRDVRVILVKLADRLHNMRTLAGLSSQKRLRIARETLDIYAPIAHRLGLNQVYRELQDLCFAHVHPMRYGVLKRAIQAARGNRRESVDRIEEDLKQSLLNIGLQAKIFSREKTLYGIYRKMQRKHLSFSEVLDVQGYRIVVETHTQCYMALGALHTLYKPIPGKFQDFIAIPKINNYQSLHTTLIGPYGMPIEFQIRTEAMHRVAENGVAAHWIYKADDASLNDLQRRTHSWLQSLLDVQQHSGDASEFLEHVKIDLFPDAVYVFTPKSKIVSLPRGATGIDFAYQIHTQVGNQAVAVRINGVNAPLRTELKSGDVVEIVTSAGSKPNPGWLGFVRTAKARFEIRHALRTSNLPEAIALGKRLLTQAFGALEGSIDSLSDEDWKQLAEIHGVKDRDTLYADIGLGRRLAQVIARRAFADYETATHTHSPTYSHIVISGAEGSAVQCAPCCRPIPGDNIIGQMRKGHGLMLHLADCKLALKHRNKDPDRWIDDVSWADRTTRPFETGVVVTAKNQRGALGRIAGEIARSDVNIIKVDTANTDDSNLVEDIFIVQVNDRLHLAALLRNLRHVPDVVRVSRSK
jgi:guanosine-3',5'-bis(diphosphate) 3'-pyrophosphohydrolase